MRSEVLSALIGSNDTHRLRQRMKDLKERADCLLRLMLSSLRIDQHIENNKKTSFYKPLYLLTSGIEGKSH